jgi:hypothetical protein
MSTALKEVIQAAVTQAVTQAVADAKVAAHPVGSYYWSSESTDPSTLFGGTWEQVKDVFVLAAGVSYAVGATGGEATHTLSYNEMPAHNHTQYVTANKNSGGTAIRQDYVTDSTGLSLYPQCDTGMAGGGLPHNNMPPYIVSYCWKRTA